MRPSRISALVASLAVATAAGGASLTTAATHGPTLGGGTISVRLFFNPATLDPQAASDIAARGLASYAYSTPVALRNGKIVPELAYKWTVTPTSAKLWIRSGVTCSDGSKLTAAEVAASIGRMANPATRAPRVVAIFGTASGFSAHADRSDNTVSIKLAQPYGDLLTGLAELYVICRAGLDNPSQLLTKTFGSGPYVLSEAVPSDHFTYVARKGYKWGPGRQSNSGPGWPDKIIFKVIDSETTATNLFLTGGLDLTMAQGPDRARLQNSPLATTKKAAVVDIYTMYLNHLSTRVTSDVNVRRALAAGLNRTDFAHAILGPTANAPQTMVRPDGVCYEPKVVGSSYTRFSVTAAQQDAAAAGYQVVGGKLMKDGHQLTVKVLIPDVFGSAAADYLVSAWGKVGIQVIPLVEPVSQAVGTAYTPGSDWDVFMAGGVGFSPPGVLTQFSSPAPPRGNNVGSVDNPAYAHLAAKAAAMVTTSACSQWAAAERVLNKNVDMIPWAQAQAAWFGHKVSFVPWLLSAVYPDSLRRGS
jgi:peptide/nickel transport system substrate-binding protein